ncbi:MAG: hypothetical protein KC502_18180 [Myxococcales bacterium]|nr:hypothetical protein [Myxococcales bacterium]
MLGIFESCITKPPTHDLTCLGGDLHKGASKSSTLFLEASVCVPEFCSKACEAGFGAKGCNACRAKHCTKSYMACQADK